MPSVGFLDVHQNCFPLPQRRIPLCFSTPNRFRVMTVLNERRERIACSNGRGKEGGFQKRILCGSDEREIAGRAKGEDEDEGDDEFCASQIDAFNTRLAQSTTERRRMDVGREEGVDEEDEHH